MPEPNSPTTPERGPRLDREAHLADRRDLALGRREAGRQLLDLEHRGHGLLRCPFLAATSSGDRAREKGPARGTGPLAAAPTRQPAQAALLERASC